MTLHRITTSALLRALQDAQTVRVMLTPARFQQLASAAAMDGDTPEQAVRALIDAYCADWIPATRRHPPGSWSTQPLRLKPQPRSARVLEQT